MDTRYWGPSGWRLLHLIAASPYASKSKQFWEMLPYILPCKFCRASLSDYYIEHPIPSTVSNKWLYVIHSCVNTKLRKQGMKIEKEPSLKEVLNYYDEFYAQGCTKTIFPGWEFLFSIADNHPGSSPSVSMPDTPTENPPTSLKERNRYNLLTIEERKHALEIFWKVVPCVLPFKEWQDSWRKHAGPVKEALQNRRTAMAWLWKIRCGMESDLEQISTTNFHGLCKEVATYRSGCSKSRKARTCRRSKDSLKKVRRKTFRNKQR
jgi:Erv1 / Alr family